MPPAGPVAEAVAYAGADAITYALARLLPRGPARVDARLAAAHHLGNPAYAVQYAHAHAASALRQAADLGLGRGEAAEFQPRLLAHPSEQALLNKLSWLPERVAGAARRARPDVLTHFLEGLARAYFDCQETCPAVRPGMVVPDGTDRSPAGAGRRPGRCRPAVAGRGGADGAGCRARPARRGRAGPAVSRVRPGAGTGPARRRPGAGSR